MNSNSFFVKVVTRDETIFEGEVLSLSARNRTGLFDILPVHANFVSLLDELLLLHKLDGTTQEIRFDDGVVRVVEGRANVYLGVKVLGR